VSAQTSSVAEANRRAKAEPIARALLRRGLSLPELGLLPYARPRGERGPSVLAFVRQAYREAGTPELNPPSSRQSDTWRHVARRCADLIGLPADLLDDRGTWIMPKELPPWPEVKLAPSPAPGAGTTSTTTTSTADVSSSHSGPPTPEPHTTSSRATAVGEPEPFEDPDEPDDSTSAARCATCSRRIRWVTVETGTGLIAVDVKPVKKGAWIIDADTMTARPAWREPDAVSHDTHRCVVRRADSTSLDGAVLCARCFGPMDPAVLLDDRGRVMNRHPSCQSDAEKPPPLKLLQVSKRDGTGMMPAFWGPFWAPGDPPSPRRRR
jgi:hypothetical protein